MENTNLIQLNTEHFKTDLFKEIHNQMDQLRREFLPKQAEEFLTRKETANIFKVNFSTLQNWCKKGYLNKYAIGNRIYFRKSEIEESIIQIN